MDEKKVREAIEFLQRQIATLEAQKDWDEYGQPLYNEILDETIEYYDLAVAALEKQLPKRVDFEEDVTEDMCAECPSCGSFLGYQIDCLDENYQIDYCQHCGQKLDWSE